VEPLLRFKSKIEGKNADVAIYVDRIEWSKETLSAGKALAAGATLGLSLLKTGTGGRNMGTEMIPVKAVSSVTTKRDGLTVTRVTVIASGNTIDFRVPHAEAEGIKGVLTQLILGNHPAQQTAASPAVSTPAPPPMRPSLPPPPPGTAADWLPDPSGRFVHRYWDGSRWTEHVHDGTNQATDQP
jgi:hypothetical protein